MKCGHFDTFCIQDANIDVILRVRVTGGIIGISRTEHLQNISHLHGIRQLSLWNGLNLQS